MVNYFKIFCKKFWWVFVALSGLLVVSVVMISIIFIDNLYEFSAWASLVSGVWTYIGSSFLGIVVFYNSWALQYKTEHVHYDLSLQISDDNSSIFEYINLPEKDVVEIDHHVKNSYMIGHLDIKECYFCGVQAMNLNSNYPMRCKVVQVKYGFERGKIYDVEDYYVVHDKDPQIPLGNREEINIFVGINKFNFYKKIDYKYFKVIIILMIFNQMGSREFVQLEIKKDGMMTSCIIPNRKIKVDNEICDWRN